MLKDIESALTGLIVFALLVLILWAIWDSYLIIRILGLLCASIFFFFALSGRMSKKNSDSDMKDFSLIGPILAGVLAMGSAGWFFYGFVSPGAPCENYYHSEYSSIGEIKQASTKIGPSNFTSYCDGGEAGDTFAPGLFNVCQQYKSCLSMPLSSQSMQLRLLISLLLSSIVAILIPRKAVLSAGVFEIDGNQSNTVVLEQELDGKRSESKYMKALTTSEAITNLGDKVSEMKVSEIAISIGKTEKGVKIALGMLGISALDYRSKKLPSDKA